MPLRGVPARDVGASRSRAFARGAWERGTVCESHPMQEHDNPWTRRRLVFSAVTLLLMALYAVWYFSPGVPVLWGPWALAGTKAAGKTLFEHEWTPNDPLASGDG